MKRIIGLIGGASGKELNKFLFMAYIFYGG